MKGVPKVYRPQKRFPTNTKELNEFRRTYAIQQRGNGNNIYRQVAQRKKDQIQPILPYRPNTNWAVKSTEGGYANDDLSTYLIERGNPVQNKLFNRYVLQDPNSAAFANVGRGKHYARGRYTILPAENAVADGLTLSEQRSMYQQFINGPTAENKMALKTKEHDNVRYMNGM